MLSVKDVRERYGVSEGTVLGWVAAGELRGTNVARKTGTRPRWRFSESAVAEFETTRAHTPLAPKTRRRPRRQANVIEFY